MSKFFVGQRVRIKYWRFGPAGAVEPSRAGVIVDIGPWRAGESWHGRTFPLHADCIVKTESGELTAPTFDQLEPILPEGAAPSEFTTLHDLLNSLEGVAA